jgi:CRP-like cAMP-binding protein
MPEQFIALCNRLSPLTEAARANLSAALKTKAVERGAYLLEEGKICRHLFFINQGLAKTFFYKEDKEFIMQFFTENRMFTVLDSFQNQAPSTYNIIALEPTNVTYLPYGDLEQLCKQHHCMETFYRKLLAVATTNMMLRISEMLEENPAQAYANFVNSNNHLLQRISLGDLAGYLGITQVSLSRIRARK